MSQQAEIGVTGLAVMGRNLARNFARHGHAVAIHNRTYAKTQALLDEAGDEGTFIASESLEDFVASLAKPRKVIIMVKAGRPTDAVIDALVDPAVPPLPPELTATQRQTLAKALAAGDPDAAAVRAMLQREGYIQAQE